MKAIKNILIASALVFLLSCTPKEKKQENVIYEVKITEAFQKNQEVNLSEITDGEIEYIQLDSEKDHLLAQNPQFYLLGNEIFAFAKQQIFVFDRLSGKFLKEIGNYGKGPDGYRQTVTSYPYDENKNLFYTSGWKPEIYQRYDSSGGLKDKITAYSDQKDADIEKSQFGEFLTSIAPLNDTCFVGSVWNIDGKQKTKLVIFNENNHRIKTYPQYQSFEWDLKKNGLNVFPWYGWFYKFENRLNFYERFSDTIFTVSMDKLLPKYVLSNGNFGAPYTVQYTKDYNLDNYFFVENLFESEKFLFFKFLFQKEYYYGFYNKVKNITEVSMNKEGLENDVDDFVPFQFYSANIKGEIIGSRDAFEVKRWFEQNPEKAAILPPNLQKLKDINETDNPVVMIAKLKE